MSTSLKMIPLSQLQRSKINVRKTGASAGIKGLAASIHAHGLLENLVVSPASDKKSVFDVIAGGRRLAALQLLVKQKKLKRDHPVPCQIRKVAEAELTELSLAENFAQMPLHPADQYDAFALLSAEGRSADEIGARFGVTATFVAQRLKLAAVSPKLLALYRQNLLKLEQLMAFTVSDDHAAQEAVWARYPSPDLAPDSIREQLTRTRVNGRDRRAVFVGIEAYERAGGAVDRDLFAPDQVGYLADSQLIDRLAQEKLEALARDIQAEGWKWVETAIEPDFDRLSRFGRARPVERPLITSDRKLLSRLAARYDELTAELEEGDKPEAERELDALSDRITCLQEKQLAWSKDALAGSGALVCLKSNGTPRVHRGLVKPEDRRVLERAEEILSKPAENGKQALSDAVLSDLTAHRTAALREVLASQPEAALTALLEVMVTALFFGDLRSGCIAVRVSTASLDRYSKTVGESKPGSAFAARHARWQKRLPAPNELWQWLGKLKAADGFTLLAHCVALTIDGVRVPHRSSSMADDAVRLGDALGLDMAKWWRPTADNFLNRITKAQIVEAVTEGISAAEAHRLHGKKEDMAAKAEALLAKTTWLPAPLRDVVPSSAETAEIKETAE